MGSMLYRYNSDRKALRSFKPFHQSGYTLVELSIVVIIISLLTAGGLATGAAMVERAAYIDTKKILTQLHTSVKDYYIVNGRLPCAASMTAAPGDSNFGAEVSCSSNVTGTWRSSGTRIGAVPTRALGVSDAAAADKYGNRIVYAVSEALTDANTFGAAGGAIAIRDANNNLILSDAAVFMASPGRDRKGAYNHQTGALVNACSPATHLDTQNCSFSDNVFREAPFNNGDIAAAFFDDLTAWSPKFHFMAFDTQNTALWSLQSGTQNIFSIGADSNTSTTNVGIGTSTPSHLLHVEGVTRTQSLYLRGASLGTLADLRSQSASHDDFILGIVDGGTSSSGSPISNHEIIFMNADYNNAVPDDGMSFINYGQDGPNLAMRIRGTGNIGVGTAEPDTKLEIYGNDYPVMRSIRSTSSVLSVNHALALQQRTTGVMADGFGAGLIFEVQDSAGGPYRVARLQGIRYGGDNQGAFVFRTLDGADTWPTRMRISNDNTTVWGSGSTCTIGTGTGNTACTSDARLKQDVQQLPSGTLDKLLQIKGVHYRWNDKSRYEDKDTHRLGVIAQDVQAVFPEAVMEDEEGYLMVSSDALVPVLIEAIRELRAEADAATDAVQATGDSPANSRSSASPALILLLGIIAALLFSNAVLLRRLNNKA